MCEGLDHLRSKLGTHFCTGCRYCMECPSGVDIPRYLQIYNYWKGFGLESWAREEMDKIPPEKLASHCNQCGLCESKCPNKLPVRKMLKHLQSHLS